MADAPAAPQALVFPDEEFRAHPPVAGAPHPFRLPPVAPFTLPSGIAAYLVENHTLPVVSIELSFPGAGATDPPGKEGLASVCMAMLTEGTEALDKLAYAETLADTASTISGYASDDAAGIIVSSLRKHFDATFALFVDTLRTPGFRASDFERMIRRRIEGVRQAKRSPAAVASRVAGAVLYGLDHPFGAVITEASLAAITLDDCKAFVQAYLVPERAQLFVVGDLTEAEIRAWFASPRLAGWHGQAPAPPALPAPETMAGRIFFVDIPGSVQSTVSYLQLGPPRSAPDYFATALMAAVLGGGFTSRLNMNLREAKGYSYSARGGFSYTASYGVFAATSQVVGNATCRSILEIDREIRGLAAAAPDRAITAEELEREKLGAILGLPGRFATAQAALGQYRALVYYSLPLDYYDSYAARIAEVSIADAMATAAQHLDPEHAVYVVVGDGSELREALIDLAARGDVGDGGLVELDADGRVLKIY